MRFGLCLDPGRPWPELLAVAQASETLGFDRVYVCDHFIPADREGADTSGFMLEAWTVLAGLAALTDRIGLGTLVLGNTYRHPAVVANMAATLDRLSEGRLVLGIGAGWQRNEHEAYGIALPDPAQRSDQLEEACEVIRSLLTNERTTFSGEWYQLTDARCDPKPVQTRLPLLVGGAGEKRTLRTAARWADEWHDWCTPEEFRHKNEVLDGHCAAAGRDPATLRRATGGHLGVDGAVELLEEYRDAGAAEFIVRDNRAEQVEQSSENLSRLSADVFPYLKR